MNEHIPKQVGRFWIHNDFVETGLKTLSGNATKVLLAITRHYNAKGTCYPSIRRLAGLAGIHHGTARKCIDELQLRGFIEQLVVKERCKLRYVFTSTARKSFMEPNNLLAKPDTKEVIKELNKGNKKFVSIHPDPTYRELEEQAGYKMFNR